MNKSSQYQLLSIVLLLLLIAGIGVFILPMKTKNGELKVERQAVAQLRDESQQKLDQLTGLLDSVAKSEAAKKALLDSVPVGLSQDDLILELKELSDEADYNLVNLSFAKKSAEEGVQVVSVNASLSGTYNDLIQFLKAIEGARRTFEVNSISVQRGDSRSILFNVSLSAFYQ